MFLAASGFVDAVAAEMVHEPDGESSLQVPLLRPGLSGEIVKRDHCAEATLLPPSIPGSRSFQ